MPPAIRIENLGKRYRVNHAIQRTPYRTLRESLVSAVTAPLRRLRSGGHDGTVEDFWALRDISFDVQPGEVVGIIGRNGAGKSTLLKILSRITKPTTGRVTLRGRVGSLLEVGTGFHPELTGRENVYLNGGILGMSRKEIARKFDAIVDFAEVEKFLDTPVKRYSSGMFVRLAFSVAAHLEPEILIIDEVLAVGDASFQQKCIDSMQRIAATGKTVILVSHNLMTVRDLSTTAVAIAAGEILHVGDPDDVIQQYMQAALQLPSYGRWVDLSHSSREGEGGIRFGKMMLAPENGHSLLPFGSLHMHLTLDATEARGDCYLVIRIQDRFGRTLVHVNGGGTQRRLNVTLGENDVRCCLPSVALVPGLYTLGISIGNGIDLLDRIDHAAALEVVDDPLCPNYGSKSDGLIACEFLTTQES